MVRTFDTQLKHVAYRYAILLNAKITRTTLSRELEEDPYYPTLKCLRRVFSKFGITGQGFNVPGDDIIKAGKPFLALLKIDNRYNDFVLVQEVTTTSVSYIYENSRAHTLSREAFNERFQGVIWVAQPATAAAEPDYDKNARLEKRGKLKKYGLVTAALFVLASILYPTVTSPVLAPLIPALFLKVAGLAISCILLLYELDRNNAVVRMFCAAPGTEKSCDPVLGSSASKIFGLGLGELCFLYFLSTSVLLLLPAFSVGQKALLLVSLNACTLPFIPFSLYYQGIKLKHWCALCLSVITVLVAEALVLWLVVSPQVQFRLAALQEAYVVASCLLFPFVLWLVLKDILTRAKERNKYYTEFKRWEHDPDIFRMRLLKQRPIPPGWDNLGIRDGDAAAPVVIVMVSEPYCGPCSQAHLQLHQLLTHNANVQVHTVFINGNTDAVKGTVVARHLLAIGESGRDIRRALHDWYEKRDLAYLQAKYPADEIIVKNQNARLEQMYEWCKAADISFTPSIYINGYHLPENYDSSDIKYLL